jgi:hypothetical protein
MHHQDINILKKVISWLAIKILKNKKKVKFQSTKVSFRISPKYAEKSGY